MTLERSARLAFGLEARAAQRGDDGRDEGGKQDQRRGGVLGNVQREWRKADPVQFVGEFAADRSGRDRR
jgi:hypothetical protein